MNEPPRTIHEKKRKKRSFIHISNYKCYLIAKCHVGIEEEKRTTHKRLSSSKLCMIEMKNLNAINFFIRKYALHFHSHTKFLKFGFTQIILCFVVALLLWNISNSQCRCVFWECVLWCCCCCFFFSLLIHLTPSNSDFCNIFHVFFSS